MNCLVERHGARDGQDRLDGPFGISMLVMGTSTSEADDLLKLGEMLREVFGHEGLPLSETND
jgi:hypothetical protein